MLKSLRKKLSLSRFIGDDRGSIKMFAALGTPFLLLMTGAGVDTAEVYRAKINFQNAVDAGTLMAAKTLAGTGDKQLAAESGKEVFLGNIRNIAANIDDADITFNLDNVDCSAQPIVSNATLKKRVFFSFMRAATANMANGQVIDGSQKATEDEKTITMRASAEVQCGSDTIEIAMVLDNSGSMRYNGKINTLRSAAANLVNTMHTNLGNSGKTDPLKFSLVPFSSMVNVGSGNRNSGWMDTSGQSSIHHENLTWGPAFTQVGNGFRNSSGQFVSRFSLYDQLPNISWKGCVEARPYPHHTEDTAPGITDPDTLFVPTFAPDTPDNWTGQREREIAISSPQARCTRFQTRGFYTRRGRFRTRSVRFCLAWSDGRHGTRHPQNFAYRPHWDDRIQYNRGNYIGPTGGSLVWVDGNLISEEWYQNNYLRDDHNFPAALNEDPRMDKYTGTDDGYFGGQYARQKWAWKYLNNANPHDVNNGYSRLPNVFGVQGGPNVFCESQPLTDLTTSKSAVINAISSMQAQGATNVQAGIGWGWRTLSPTEPFTNGRDYTQSDNKKIMIVMTDGNNTAYPINFGASGHSLKNKSYYDTFAHSVNNRIFDGFTAIANPNHDFNTFRQAMDSHMAKTCTNAKNAGIRIYSIAFDVPNGSSVKTLLENCASTDVGGSKLYFDAANNAQLVSTFQTIAEQLSELTITK